MLEIAYPLFKKLTDDFEILVIDDSGRINLSPALNQLADKYPKLKIIKHHKNLGYGAVLKTGFANSKLSLTGYCDGDGQYDLGQFPRLLKQVSGKTNFVNGFKKSRSDPWYRKWLGEVYRNITKIIFRLPVNDPDCDFRLIKTSLVKKIKLKSKSGAVCIELIKKAEYLGAVFKQVPVEHFNRRHGNSRFFRLKPLLLTGKEVLSLWIDMNIN